METGASQQFEILNFVHRILEIDFSVKIIDIAIYRVEFPVDTARKFWIKASKRLSRKVLPSNLENGARI